MGVVTQGAPVFTIGGDPGGIATRAAVMMDRANEFAEIHSSLSSLKADGWTGRAANRFREKYKLQLKGWLDAQEAFSSASTAYSTYASTLQSAQSQCDEIRSRWEQGRRAVEQAQNNKADARSRAQAEGGIPMIDASCDEGPGRATMQGAEEDFQALVNEVNEAGNQLNSVLDEGISKLPERTWLDAVSRTAGSFGLGVKDAVTDLFNLLFLGTPTLLNDFRRLITGGLTPEEFLVSYSDVPAEKLESFFTELSNNPQKFFEDAFYSLIDGETWADDPGRAFGRLAPDIALTYATAGAAAAAKGLKGAARAAFIGRELVLSVTHISDVSDLVRASRRLAGRLARIGSDAASSLAGLGSHLPHSGTTPHPHVPTAPTSPTGHSGTPTMPSSGAPSYPSHGAPSMPSTGAPSYGTGGTPSASTSPSYGSGSTPNTSGMSAPSHGNGGYSGNPSHGGVGAVDPNSRFAPPGQQNNGMSGATHSGEAGTTDPTSKYAPPTHQQNGTPGAAQPGTTPQASSAGTSGATTPAAGSHGTSGTASTGAGTATPTAGAHGNPSGPAHNGMAGEGVSAADGLPPRRNIDPDEPRNTSNNDFHSSADKGESYDAGNRKDSNHLNVDSRDFDKSSNGQYSPSNNSGSPQRGTGGTDELVGAGVGRSEASVGAQGSYERAGAFGGSDPSRVSHGADGFGGTADFGANAGHGGHGANGVTNSADTSGGLGSTPSSSHSTGSFTGHGAGHVGADSGTHSGSSTPAQGSYPAAGNSHGTSHADSGSGAGHSGSHQAGQGANGHSGASSSHDAPNTGSGAPKSEPPIPAPPKDNDPIPAPPKSEAPSSHSLSDTAHAPHTGADNAAGMQHADQSLGSANKADAPSTAMDEADLPTREIDGNAVRRRAGATAGNPDDFSWENNIANKSGKADNAGMPQHTSDPTVGADTHHAPHTGADGAADMSHAGHGDTGGHTADGKPHAADPTTPTHEADGATDAPATKNKFDELLGNPNTHGTTHAPTAHPRQPIPLRPPTRPMDQLTFPQATSTRTTTVLPSPTAPVTRQTLKAISRRTRITTRSMATSLHTPTTRRTATPRIPKFRRETTLPTIRPTTPIPSITQIQPKQRSPHQTARTRTITPRITTAKNTLKTPRTSTAIRTTPRHSSPTRTPPMAPMTSHGTTSGVSIRIQTRYTSDFIRSMATNTQTSTHALAPKTGTISSKRHQSTKLKNASRGPLTCTKNIIWTSMEYSLRTTTQLRSMNRSTEPFVTQMPFFRLKNWWKLARGTISSRRFHSLREQYSVDSRWTKVN